MTLSVRVTTKSHLSEFAAALPGVVDNRLRITAENIRDKAKVLAPIAPPVQNYREHPPGYLKESIHDEKISDEEYQVIVDAAFARYVEWATRFTHAQPFLRPAAESERIRLASELHNDVDGLALTLEF